MSIKSSAFGGVKLTGDDAKRFVAHANSKKPNEAAAAAVARGVAMAKARSADGVVRLKLKDGKFVHAI